MLKAFVRILIERLISGVSSKLTPMTTEDRCKLHAVMMNVVASISVWISQSLVINHMRDTTIVSSLLTIPNRCRVMLLDPQTTTHMCTTSHLRGRLPHPLPMIVDARIKLTCIKNCFNLTGDLTWLINTAKSLVKSLIRKQSLKIIWKTLLTCSISINLSSTTPTQTQKPFSKESQDFNVNKLQTILKTRMKRRIRLQTIRNSPAISLTARIIRKIS